MAVNREFAAFVHTDSISVCARTVNGGIESVEMIVHREEPLIRHPNAYGLSCAVTFGTTITPSTCSLGANERTPPNAITAGHVSIVGKVS